MDCRNVEGWHVVSTSRDFDLAPCFEDGILVPAVLAAVVVLTVSKTLSLCLRASRPVSSRSVLCLRAKLVRTLAYRLAPVSDYPTGSARRRCRRQHSQPRTHSAFSHIRARAPILYSRAYRARCNSRIYLLQPHPHAQSVRHPPRILAAVHSRSRRLDAHACLNRRADIYNRPRPAMGGGRHRSRGLFSRVIRVANGRPALRQVRARKSAPDG